jgi:hypothetical protein
MLGLDRGKAARRPASISRWACPISPSVPVKVELQCPYGRRPRHLGQTRQQRWGSSAHGTRCAAPRLCRLSHWSVPFGPGHVEDVGAAPAFCGAVPRAGQKVKDRLRRLRRRPRSDAGGPFAQGSSVRIDAGGWGWCLVKGVCVMHSVRFWVCTRPEAPVRADRPGATGFRQDQSLAGAALLLDIIEGQRMGLRPLSGRGCRSSPPAWCRCWRSRPAGGRWRHCPVVQRRIHRLRDDPDLLAAPEDRRSVAGHVLAFQLQAPDLEPLAPFSR